MKPHIARRSHAAVCGQLPAHIFAELACSAEVRCHTPLAALTHAHPCQCCKGHQAPPRLWAQPRRSTRRRARRVPWASGERSAAPSPTSYAAACPRCGADSTRRSDVSPRCSSHPTAAPECRAHIQSLAPASAAQQSQSHAAAGAHGAPLASEMSRRAGHTRQSLCAVWRGVAWFGCAFASAPWRAGHAF